MSHDATTLGALAVRIRAKNAGPFWMTLDVFLPDDEAYARAAAEGVVTEEAVAGIYAVAPESVRIFRLPELQVLKISFPRRVPQGSLEDRDMHAGQQHVPLMALPVPAVAAAAHAGAP